MAEVSIIIPAFGGHEWIDRAQEAIESAHNQTQPAHEILLITEGQDVCEVRNTGAAQATGEWLCFLDADDAISPNYIEAMLSAEGDIRKPSTAPKHSKHEVSMIPAKPLVTGNHIVIGALVRKDQFFSVGGFDPYPMFEDWALWLKLSRAGASIGQVRDAVYYIDVQRAGKRNDQLHQSSYYFHKIRSKFFPGIPYEV